MSGTRRTSTSATVMTLALALVTTLSPLIQEAEARGRRSSPRSKLLSGIGTIRSGECLPELSESSELTHIARKIARGLSNGSLRPKEVHRPVAGLNGDHVVTVTSFPPRKPRAVVRALLGRPAFRGLPLDRRWDHVGVGAGARRGRLWVAVILGTAVLPSDSTPAAFLVPDSIPADCSRPVEDEIMDWLATVPDGATARFKHNGCYGQDKTIELEDRTDLTIHGNGSTFKALTRGSPNRDNWRIEGGRGITLTDMTVCGANPHAGIHKDAYDGSVEWQHGFRFAGTVDGTLDNVRVFDVYGDFVEAMWDWRHPDVYAAPMARNIVVRDSHFARAGRMGMGLTGVDGFLLTNSYVGDVNMAAVDLELDVDTHLGRNISIINNVFGPHRFAMFANGGVGSAPNVGNVVISGNRMTGPLVSCESPVYVGPPEGDIRSGWVIEDNHFLTLSEAVSATRVRDMVVRGNQVQYEPWGGCSRYSGVGLRDAHTVNVLSNAFAGADRVLQVDAVSTNIHESGNSL